MPETWSHLYSGQCVRCPGGDVLVRFIDSKPVSAQCMQCATTFDRRSAPKIQHEPPEGLTARKYVDIRLFTLPPGGIKEIPHVDWLTCRSAKEGCTLASAIREFRRDERERAGKLFEQRHDYPAIRVERLR